MHQCIHVSNVLFVLQYIQHIWWIIVNEFVFTPLSPQVLICKIGKQQYINLLWYENMMFSICFIAIIRYHKETLALHMALKVRINATRDILTFFTWFLTATLLNPTSKNWNTCMVHYHTSNIYLLKNSYFTWSTCSTCCWLRE